MEHCAEGNTNQAFFNLMNSLNTTKLKYIKEVCRYYIKDHENEAVDWLDNNLGIFFVGFLTHAKNKKKKAEWEAMMYFISEKAPYLKRASSFESIVLFLLKQETSVLIQLVKAQKACYEPKDKKKRDCEVRIQSGGSNKLVFINDFVEKVIPGNAIIAKKIMNMYYIEKDPLETDSSYRLGASLTRLWNLQPGTFAYSNRTDVDDVWNMTMFMLMQKNDVLKEKYTLLQNVKKKKKGTLL
jgi:hypothetical protein